MKQFLFAVTAGVIATLLFGCTTGVEDNVSMVLSSTSFANGGQIPSGCSCEGKPFGEGTTPELHWTAGPAGTKSYAIVFQDTTIVGALPNRGNHWIIWNIPASVASLPAGLSGEQFPPAMGGAQQQNAAPAQAAGPYIYFGPCPNWDTYCSGAARTTDTYAFTIYAFDFETIVVPEKDTTDPTNKNYVRQINDFLAARATASAKLFATSDAAPTSFDFCPVAMADSEYPSMMAVGSKVLVHSLVAVNTWYSTMHIPLLTQYTGLQKSDWYQNATTGGRHYGAVLVSFRQG